MKNAQNASKALAVASILLAAACSNGSGSGGGGSLYIESCSLGCGDGAGGSQVSCSIDLVGLHIFDDLILETKVHKPISQLLN